MKNKKKIIVSSIIVLGMLCVAFAAHMYLSQYNVNGISKYPHYNTVQTKKEFVEIGSLENYRIYTYGVEDVIFHTFSAKEILLEDYVSRSSMTVQKLLTGKHKTLLSEDVTEYTNSFEEASNLKFIIFDKTIIVTLASEDSEAVAQAFKDFLLQ